MAKFKIIQKKPHLKGTAILRGDNWEKFVKPKKNLSYKSLNQAKQNLKTGDALVKFEIVAITIPKKSLLDY